MRLTVMVHDAVYEVGHSKAMFETLRLLPNYIQLDEIKVVAYRFSPKEVLFPEFSNTVKYLKVPSMPMRPFLLRDIFYHLFSLIYYLFFRKRDELILGIGTSSLYQDICDIQWIHHQWSPIYLKKFCPPGLRGVYKRFLHFYSLGIENVFFSNKKRHYLCLAKFIEKYLADNFLIRQDQLHLAYSSVNQTKFRLKDESRDTTFEALLESYPQLSILDRKKPIVLFAGALERKGYFEIVSFLQSAQQEIQLIAIGEAEFSRDEALPPLAAGCKVVRVKHTKQIELFYQLCDLFLFPSLYDPFGLVIIEAWAMGLDIVVPEQNIGASEIIKNTSGVLCYKMESGIPSFDPRLLSVQDKKDRIKTRIPLLAEFSWENKAKKLAEIITAIGGIK